MQQGAPESLMYLGRRACYHDERGTSLGTAWLVLGSWTRGGVGKGTGNGMGAMDIIQAPDDPARFSTWLSSGTDIIHFEHAIILVG